MNLWKIIEPDGSIVWCESLGASKEVIGESEKIQISLPGATITRRTICDLLNHELEDQREKHGKDHYRNTLRSAGKHAHDARGAGPEMDRHTEEPELENKPGNSGNRVRPLQVRSRSSGYCPAYQRFPFYR